MLSPEDREKLINELIKEDKNSNLADYSRELAEIEAEIAGVVSCNQ